MHCNHFICGGEGLVDLKNGEFTSEAWDVDENFARSLVGANLYLHFAKKEPAYFGGRVLGYEMIHTRRAHSIRAKFTLWQTHPLPAVSWPATQNSLEWLSGLVKDVSA